MVDLSRDQAGCLHARLLDAVVGRSGSVYKAWLKAQPEGFIDGVEQAALDPFRGYANAIHDGLPDSVAVLDAFHVVRLGTQVVDEVRRRVQQDTLGRRGHKYDPLYQIRGLLRHGVEHLTEKQQAKISRCLDAGDSTAEVNVTWQCYQQLRSIYHATPAKGREIAVKVLDSFHTCPIPEVARLGPHTPGLAGPATVQPKRSVSVVPAGLGLAGQDGPGRVVRCVTHEAIDPFGGVFPLNCPHRVTRPVPSGPPR
jgi:transposase